MARAMPLALDVSEPLQSAPSEPLKDVSSTSPWRFVRQAQGATAFGTFTSRLKPEASRCSLMTLRLVRGRPTTLATAVKHLLLALVSVSAGAGRAGVEDNRQAETRARRG